MPSDNTPLKPEEIFDQVLQCVDRNHRDQFIWGLCGGLMAWVSREKLVEVLQSTWRHTTPNKPFPKLDVPKDEGDHVYYRGRRFRKENDHE